MNIKDRVLDIFENKEWGKWKSKAEEYTGDKDKARELLDEAEKKAEARKKGPIGEIMDKVQLLFSMFKDCINGVYKDIPKGSLLMITIGLVYFVSPVDIIPDFLLAGGFIDDATVLTFIIRQISSDLERYKEWRAGRKEIGAEEQI